MSVLFIMLPAALFIAAIAAIAFIRSAKSGQYDDLDTPALRMLSDDDAASKTTRPDRTDRLR